MKSNVWRKLLWLAPIVGFLFAAFCLLQSWNLVDTWPPGETPAQRAVRLKPEPYWNFGFFAGAGLVIAPLLLILLSATRSTNKPEQHGFPLD
jgi:hypothetical protein